MRFSTTSLISMVLMTIQSVSAIGDLAFNLGVQSKSGACKTANDYKSDFDALSSYSKIIKFYSASDCNTLEILGPTAENAGFEVFVGIWPTDDSHFKAEQETLSSQLPKLSVSTIKGFLVGSEALYRGDLSPSALANDITTIKNLIKNIKDKDGNSYSNVPVGTVDSWNIMVDGSSEPVVKASDMVFVNAFSYWQGQTMNNATYSFVDDIMQALQVIQTAKGTTDITFWVGETGWPTGGSSFESATPSTENAARYWSEAICGIRAWGINVVAFEAFDESWKPETSGTGDVEKHWGIFDDTRKLKYPLSCDLS